MNIFSISGCQPYYNYPNYNYNNKNINKAKEKFPVTQVLISGSIIITTTILLIVMFFVFRAYRKTEKEQKREEQNPHQFSIKKEKKETFINSEKYQDGEGFSINDITKVVDANGKIYQRINDTLWKCLDPDAMYLYKLENEFFTYKKKLDGKLVETNIKVKEYQ